MAREKSQAEIAAEAERKKLQDEKKKFKNDQKAQKKEAKRRAREIARQEEELSEDGGGGGVVTFLATIVIVALWLAVICIVVKMDIGGFGSSVLAPVLKDVPVVNKILPAGSMTQTTNPGGYGGYSSIQDAVAEIERLRMELEVAQLEATNKNAELDALKAEVQRLQEFEAMQTEFDRVRMEFFEQVIYAEKGPGPEEYQKYYELINPASAEYLYKQVVAQVQESKEIQDYADAYASGGMDPGAAAKILEKMTDNMTLGARILKAMSASDRGAILAAMDPDIAARYTRIMNPGS